MLVTIHQPDFMPWLGLFKKVAQADQWVVLDHVENNPRHMGYWNRVAILVNGSSKWISVSLEKKGFNGRIGIPLNQIKVRKIDGPELAKKIRMFEQSYRKAKYFNQAFELFEGYFLSSENNLSKRNLDFIKIILRLTNVKTKILLSSNLNLESSSSQMLIDILKKLNANIYLHGNGADGYHDIPLFKQNKIVLQRHNFKHPVYNQTYKGKFVPGLSIVDVIANVGLDGLADILLSTG